MFVLGKLENNKKQKKETLYSTAFELFTTKGLSKTTISDIVNKAGVAKGTFYLYFKDKYDIKNKLVTHKAQDLFMQAHKDLKKTDITDFEEQIMFIIDHIINTLKNNTSLLYFIAKNLSWGVFRNALNSSPEDSEENFYDMFKDMIPRDSMDDNSAELLLFQLVEFISSTAYSTILYNEPVSLNKFLPHMHNTIHLMINSYYHKP